MKKKGISTVIATVLIILITVAAVTIVWAVVIPMIREKTTGITSCSDAVQEVTITGACKTGNQIKFTVSHGASDIGLDSIKVIPYNADGDTITGQEITDLPGTNEEKQITTTNVAVGAEKVAFALVVSGEECLATNPVNLNACA